MTDTQGRILDVNSQAYREMGYSLAELMALNVADFALDYTRDELLALWQKMEPGEHTVATNTHQRKDGSCFPWRCTSPASWSRARSAFSPSPTTSPSACAATRKFSCSTPRSSSRSRKAPSSGAIPPICSMQ
ncbi:PAS domain S-box protein [Comamonas sp. JC664]|uniref:PAS domain S-box protein n=1 Tax=Comamonas sp. JC664 TaxID=2801917 RepID=UPI003616D417